jgi:hypothetical protein
VTARGANEWREFWATRGERELGELAPHTTRVAAEQIDAWFRNA